MFDTKLLLRAGLVGASLHVVFVLLLVLVPSLQRILGLEGQTYAVMMLCGTAGLLYARDLDKGFSAGGLGGLIVGLVTAFSGLALANLLHVPILFPLGVSTVVGTAIGALGGVFGQMAATIRKARPKM